MGTPTTGARPMTIGAVDQHIEGEGAPSSLPRPAARSGEWASEAGAQGHEDHHPVEEQDREAAQEAELLGQGREDEVGLFLGQEVELALRAQAIALAEEAAGAQGDLGLQDVVARCRRDRFPGRGRSAPVCAGSRAARTSRSAGPRATDAGDPGQDDLPGEPGQEHRSPPPVRAISDGGAEVGLVRDQHHRRADGWRAGTEELPVTAWRSSAETPW